MKRIYVCGKVTGDENYKQKFLAERERLDSLGFNAVDPTMIIGKDEPWNDAMRTAVCAMLSCEGVSLLPDWWSSRGVRIERRLARELGLDVRASRNWN
jgi:hypothetical protein